MSKSSAAKSNPTDASQQASSQALLDELRLAADRARDERLKLARLVKHSGDLPVGTDSISSASSVSDSRLAALASQIERLEQAVTDKLVSLNTAQREINSRTQYLESLRHTITDTTQAFMTQVEEAQQFKTHVDAAKQHVRVSAGRIVEEVRQQISGMDGPISERIGQLKDLDKQIDKRISRMQQMHKQANEAVDQHLLASLRNAKEQAAELAEPLKKELDEYANVQRAKLEDAMHQKINDLDVDIEEALTPLTERFDEIVNSAQQRIEQLGSEIDPLKQRVDKLVEDTKSRIGEAAKGLDPLAERIEQIVEEGQSKADLFAETIPDRLETEMETQLDSLRGRLTDKAKAIVDGVDDQAMEQAGQLIHERIAKELDGYLNEAQEHAGGYVDGLIAKLDEARDKAIEAYDRSIQKIDHVNTVEREQAMARLDDEVKRTQAMSDERIQQAQQIVEQATDGIYARAATAVDSALKAAGSKIDQFETNAADHLRLIDDKIEHEMEASRKRLVAFDKAALRQADDAVRMADDGIAEAQKRIAGFESGVTQRVSLAVRTADDARASIDERLTKAETEASRRIMQQTV